MLFWKRLGCVLILLTVCVAQPLFAASRFVLRNIVIQGTQRLSTDTVFSYLPIHEGQVFTPANGDATIKTLYNTGFFSDVRLLRTGNTLIVRVAERPTIGLLSIKGNKEIKTKDLLKVLKHMEIMEGSVYDSSKLNALRQGLEEQYSIMGHYVAVVNIRVKKEPRNQVALYINITEGPLAKVKDIHFVGNHAFSQRELRDTFTLSESGFMTIFNHHDRFSQTQLDKDLFSLKNYYYDHGYLRFKVLSKQLRFNPTHTKVYITVTVSEGPVYRISGFRIAGHPQHKAQLLKMITLQKGTVFSRSQILAINNQIANYFADRGYAYPIVNPTPQLDDAHHTVFIVFYIDRGKRIYIRQISIVGNQRTSGVPIRDELRQMESSVYSRSKIKESTRRIRTEMPYLKNVTVTHSPVANHPHEMDLVYHVKEVAAGRASLQGGYSDVQGFLYGASIVEPNFMGAARYVSLSFQRSAYAQNYAFNYNNPFYTIDGVSRGFGIYYTNTTPGKVNLESYTMRDFGINLGYGIPLTEFLTGSLGVSYDYIRIANVNKSTISPSVVQFLDKYPSPYNQFKVNAGLTYQTLDRAIFPTAGSLQSIGVTVGPPISDWSLGYVISSYNGKWYWPVAQSGFVLEPHTTLGYGHGLGSRPIPFFNNFYGGGIATLPGFDANSLGPKNPHDLSQATGGNLQFFAGLNVWAPTFFNDKLRVAAIYDIGNVWQTHRANTSPQIAYEGLSLRNIRMSAGIMVSWWWPLGAPIDVSLAFPLNKKKNDQEQIIGFSMGGSI